VTRVSPTGPPVIVTVASRPYEPDGFAATVGSATHRVIASAIERCERGSPSQHFDLVWELAADAVLVPAVSRRRPAARIAVAGHAAIYLERFLPSARWQFLGAEVDLGDGLRADLAFESEDGVIIDELKLADARAVARGRARVEQQVTAYAAHGAELWGSRFLGVRLLYLGAPNRSLAIEPDGRRLPLVESLLSAVASPPPMRDATP